MSEVTTHLDDVVARLKTERDELRVQMHLAREELKDEWQEMERHWVELERKLAAAEDEALEGSADVAVAARSLVNEIQTLYRRIKTKV